MQYLMLGGPYHFTLYRKDGLTVGSRITVMNPYSESNMRRYDLSVASEPSQCTELTYEAANFVVVVNKRHVKQTVLVYISGDEDFDKLKDDYSKMLQFLQTEELLNLFSQTPTLRRA